MMDMYLVYNNEIRGGFYMKSKGEKIAYAIRKECQRYNLVDWCEEWDITIEEFDRFLELGERGFDADEN